MRTVRKNPFICVAKNTYSTLSLQENAETELTSGWPLHSEQINS